MNKHIHHLLIHLRIVETFVCHLLIYCWKVEKCLQHLCKMTGTCVHHLWFCLNITQTCVYHPQGDRDMYTPSPVLLLETKEIYTALIYLQKDRYVYTISYLDHEMYCSFPRWKYSHVSPISSFFLDQEMFTPIPRLTITVSRHMAHFNKIIILFCQCFPPSLIVYVVH